MFGVYLLYVERSRENKRQKNRCPIIYKQKAEEQNECMVGLLGLRWHVIEKRFVVVL